MDSNVMSYWLRMKQFVPTDFKVAINKHIRLPLRQWSADDRSKPDVIIAGAQKSGTTSLYNYLKQHSQFHGAMGQEVHYFDRHFDKPMQWYQAHFPTEQQVKSDDLVGESCPDYMVHPEGARRISSTLPNVKLIFLLRNPVERAFSHYKHMVRLGREERAFPRALDGEERRINGLAEQLEGSESFYDRAYFDYSYKRRGHYRQLLEPYFEHHEREQITVLKSESLFEKPAETFEEILDFLGLSIKHDVRFSRYNPAGTKNTMEPETRERLREYYSNRNEELRSMLNWSEAW